MRIIAGLFLAVSLLTAAGAAPERETLSERTLRRLLERQHELLTDAVRQGDKLDAGSFQAQVQTLARDYELFLRGNPQSATGYAAYGRLLRQVGMDGHALGIFMKADEINPKDPMVKNQIGNLIVESGKPVEALPFFLFAIQFAPEEPLYHYQLGTLLTEARDEFLKSGEWERETIDRTMLEAFAKAAALAPDRIEFTYRHAEAYYDLEKPDWEAALRAWAALEEKAENPIERETMRLHAAQVLIKQGHADRARLVLATVAEPALAAQKQKLVAQLEDADNK